MKTVGIMQPYLFPYMGYFQLIASCDVFVWLDDVQFTRRGWINRNRILLGGNAHRFVFSVQQGGQAQPINERRYAESFPDEASRLLKTLYVAYHQARQYETVLPVIAGLLDSTERNVATFNCVTLEAICGELGISPEFRLSSSLTTAPNLRGEDRIVAIVKALGGTRYVNLIGGTTLYSFERFSREGLTLAFLKSGDVRYPQFGHGFIPQLSIIDTLMFADRTSLRGLLRDCRLLGEHDETA